MKAIGVGLLLLLALALPASATTSSIVAARDWWPVPSPDGSRIAFTRVYANHMELDVLTVATQRVAEVAASPGQLSPTWSSDSTHLAYAAGGVLYTANANGSGKKRYPTTGRAYAPAWRPGGVDLAYLQAGPQGLELWDAGTRIAPDAIGQPAWEADGSTLAFARSDGIYVSSTPGKPRRVAATTAEPGPPSWSPDGSTLAYTAGGVAFTVLANGSAQPGTVATGLTSPGRPEWSADGKSILLPTIDDVEVVSTTRTTIAGARGPGAAFLGADVVATAPVSGCPGHDGLARFPTGTATAESLAGGCAIGGTAGPDVIVGTPLWGDVIVARAGNDRIHVNDGHTDTVFCGPGRDTVWADRSDRLVGCEVVHR